MESNDLFRPLHTTFQITNRGKGGRQIIGINHDLFDIIRLLKWDPLINLNPYLVTITRSYYNFIVDQYNKCIQFTVSEMTCISILHNCPKELADLDKKHRHR